MRPLPIPGVDHRLLYEKCIAQTRDLADRSALQGLSGDVVAAGIDFSNAARAGEIANLAPIPLTDHQDRLLRPLYDQRLVRKTGHGRWAYDIIRNSTRFCPFCTFGEVYEVDHFLNKASYRELNVCPSNLVPICHPCNHIKGTLQPEGPDRYLVHPYFDVLPGIRWLFADLGFESNGPILRFRVELDPATYGTLASRLHYHFDTLELTRRFRERAVNVLVEIENDMSEMFDLLGALGMADHFESESARHFARHGNTLEAAAYLAAAENDEYCAGRFRN